MLFNKNKIKGVHLIKFSPHNDKRGYFVRTYDESVFRKKHLNNKWVQESESLSRQKNIIRGLHFQFPPYSEIKLIRVSQGKVFIVYLDLRKTSNTFGKWGKVILSENNKMMLYLPKGLALGMCTLTSNCILLYKMDTVYMPKYQGAIKWDDIDLAIDWPTRHPTLSIRDSQAMSFYEFKKKYRGLKT
jgi:dTDP-4-dehydrorhamnose 3,5-epimerase